jgi:hypothetical protein
MPGRPEAVECASGRCLTPLGLRRDRIGSARDPRPALRSDLGYQCPAPVGAEETSNAPIVA